MELVNATRMSTAYTTALAADGRQSLVIVIKGTFVLPKVDEQVRLHDEQQPMVVADVFSGEPGLSAPLHEIDFAPFKPACDVLLLGSAHAPGGRPVTRMQVGLRMGAVNKVCDVVGDRHWSAGVTGIQATSAEPFVTKSISYDNAFGGVDQESDDPAEHDACMANPVGRGYRKHLKAAWVDGRPLPNTEEPGHAVEWPANPYKPMAFGPVGRGWAPRARFAGTYDQHWLDDVFPFLPKDFDERYFLAAPLDQQTPIANGPIDIALLNFTADGRRSFVLPHFEAPVHVFPRKGEREDLHASLDTIVLEPDQERFTMTWRVARPLRRDMFELAQVLVGRKGREWWQQREEMAFPIPVVMVPMTMPARRRKQPAEA
jgi:hypothetical protein